MAQYKLVAIVGEAGSGKDSLARELVKRLGRKGHEIVSYTTRPPRDYEKDGIDYHFVDNETLAKMIYENKILEAATFNEWVYATGIDAFKSDKINVEVLNPEGIESIAQDPRIDMMVVRCICPDKERLIRQLSREEEPDIEEIIRRYRADQNDFYNFHPADWSYWNTVMPTIGLTVSQEVDMLLGYMETWAD